jgi:hypothetical protein
MPVDGIWTVWMMHGAIRAADNGSRQLSHVQQEKLFREYKANGDKATWTQTVGEKSYTVVVRTDGKCPFPAPGSEGAAPKRSSIAEQQGKSGDAGVATGAAPKSPPPQERKPSAAEAPAAERRASTGAARPWNMYLMHGAIRGADNGQKHCSHVTCEKLYRKYKDSHDPKTFAFPQPSGDVTVIVHTDGRCPFPPPS